MTDFKADINIKFNFMGKDYTFDSWINYNGSEGVDSRIIEFFEDSYRDGVQRYEKETRNYLNAEEEKCPECGHPLEYDEVDIGVGTLKGNFGCPNCHWTPPKENEN